MLFSSLTFVFVFLPITVVLYFLAKEKYKNAILLVASLIFYAWGEPKYIFLMLSSIVANFFIARMIDKNRRGTKQKKLWLCFAVVLNIGALFVFKYLDFTVNNVNVVFGTDMNLPGLNLPIGISFYTFQILSYVIDVYRNRVRVQNDIFTLGTYIALFPQLIAGPIVRYADIEVQLKHRKHSLEKFCSGLRRFLLGFLKKVLVANNVAVIADSVFDNLGGNGLNVGVVLLALMAYTLQIYYDFSGYSDMAIGLGRIFGFDFMENFNYPYSAKSVTDFWRRWHISLTTWFRDYLYIPLGGNRCSKLKWTRNFLIVWLCTGLWHGASWNFIIWGLYYAVVLWLEKMWFGKMLKKLPSIVGWVYMFIIVNFGWLLFRLESVSDLRIVLQSLVSPSGDFVGFLSNNFSIVYHLIFMIIGFIFIFPIRRKMQGFANKHTLVAALSDIMIIVFFVVSIFSLINSSYNPFIYFRF
ncbi:MAG: MBOAT family O-acyltransferase [Candidatus Saccharibacteria bacterium]|nr:MBOAT family O-acyltransferase [Candidatus Saccharibacteria bacterium]